jgi:hypothetical protein
MKRPITLFAIILALLIFCILIGWACYDRGFTEGRYGAIKLNEQSLDTSYHIGYTVGFKDALECQIDYDLCVLYPERQTILDFLETDKTNENPYTVDYQCDSFAADLIHNAWQAGYPAWLVVINVAEDPSGGHTAVAFEICQDGEVEMMYIEPQNDGEYKDLEVGKHPIICTPNFCETIPFTISKIRVFK